MYLEFWPFGLEGFGASEPLHLLSLLESYGFMPAKNQDNDFSRIFSHKEEFIESVKVLEDGYVDIFLELKK